MPSKSSCTVDCPRKSLFIALAVLTLASSLFAQTDAPPASPPIVPQIRFDVVSVRQNKSGSTAMTRQSSADSDGISITNAPLARILFYAYQINDASLIAGIPAWAMTERYDIFAKVAPSDVPAYQKLTNAQRGEMVQKLLTDRFKLQAHRETKDRPVYALVIAKGGIKMKEAKPGDSYPNGIQPHPNGFVHGATIFSTGPEDLTAQGASTGELATVLSNRGQNVFDRIVVDKTGLTGRYDFTLQVTLDQAGATVDADGQQGAPSSSSNPSIFTALPEQLGLRLQPMTAAMEYVVIDHIERPSEN
jgi:uncharacterized protein (TIGR03435 family)